MFFWILLSVMVVAFVVAVIWGARGIEGRAHKPGTKHLD